MRTPIAYSLAWPERMHAPTKRLDLAALGGLSFEAPDSARFPALDLARAALRDGKSAGTVLNAANEVAVEAFLARRIGFLAIASLVETTLEQRPDLASVAPSSIDDVLTVDGESRLAARALLDRFASPGPSG
jgi:1-deoxy-D-xylulose-5-phosphate reductoisomerase